jgi:phenylpyruvate tautomerase PptA (4-oxalocrotonate tautomerase family)
MPFVQISVPAGSQAPEQKATRVAKATNACVEAEGAAVRAQTFVHIPAAPDGGLGIGGRTFTLAMMKAVLTAT